MTRSEFSNRFSNLTYFDRFDANRDGILSGAELSGYMSELFADVVDACEWTGNDVFEDDSDEDMCVNDF